MKGYGIWRDLNGHSSRSFYINVGVPQDSILGPILFLISISDLPNAISSCLYIYAEDPTIYTCLSVKSDRFDEVKLATDLKNDLQSVNRDKKWLVNLQESHSLHLLGTLMFSTNMKYKNYIESIARFAARNVYLLCCAR